MSSVTRPRGPLPARVYWTRRLVLLALVLGLVAGVTRLLPGRSDQDPTPSARPAAAEPSTPSAGASPSARSTAEAPRPTSSAKRASDRKQKATGKKRKQRPAKPPLASPTGQCRDSDIKVTPSVEQAIAGRNVTVTLGLTTLESAACHWQAGAESLVLRLTSGDDRIWTTQDCPAALPNQAVVVRKGHTTKVDVVWSGQRSDDECTRTTAWAKPGYYHAAAAALGAEPAEVQFYLAPPPRPTITPTPKPKKQRSRD